MKNPAIPPQLRSSGALDVRIMAKAGDRVKLAVASSPDSPLPTRGHGNGYYMFSEGKRWFVSWLTTSAPVGNDAQSDWPAAGRHPGVAPTKN